MTRHLPPPQHTDPTIEPPHEGRTDPSAADADVATPRDDTSKEGKEGTSQASRLVTLAEESYRFVQGLDGKAYAVDRNGPNVAVPLRGRDGLRQRLARTYYAHHRTAPGGGALADALVVIEGLAAEADPEPIGLRVAELPDTIGDGLVLDLGDPTGRAVVITAQGWRVVTESPVLFRRTALTQALPIPDTTRGRGLDALAGLRRLLNVDDLGWGLIVGWLVAALFPSIPHPVLALLGEQGTAKTTAASFLVRLFDPSPAPVRTPPKDVRGWSVTAAASWAVALDNVSSIPAWFSDTLCKAVTGDGIVDRALFTDDDVTVLFFRRVIALTSIDAGALAGDLAERMIPVELERIDPANRRPDGDVQADYTKAAPAALAGILDLTAEVLAILPTLGPQQLPRMADFARILTALDCATGWTTLDAYTAQAVEVNHAVIDADPFATAVVQLIRSQAVGWTGTAAELLETLTPEHPPRVWPRTPRAAAGHLRRIAPALRANGVQVETERTKDARLIALRPAEPHAQPALPDPPDPKEPETTVTTVTTVTNRP